MGTKLQELRSGCFAKAMDDEEMFVLLARDTSAPGKVRDWADQREAEVNAGKRPASDMEQVQEARGCADKMEVWREKNDGAWREGLFAKQDRAHRTIEQGKAESLPGA
jgi:hypothetical protein